MQFLLSLIDVSDIFIFMSITLLLTSIILNPYYGILSLRIKSVKIRNALFLSITLFAITLIIRVFNEVIFV